MLPTSQISPPPHPLIATSFTNFNTYGKSVSHITSSILDDAMSHACVVNWFLESLSEDPQKLCSLNSPHPPFVFRTARVRLEALSSIKHQVVTYFLYN